jgi:RNA polymerase sigma-70 factor (sigma-E family)
MGAAGWEAEFVEYFTAQHGALRRLAYALCGDWHTADDAVQHTFVQLYRHWARVRPASLDSYVRTILVNAVRSQTRRRRRELTTAEPPDSVAPTTDPGLHLDLRRALARLPRRQREMVVLRHLENLSVSEVAEVLGVAEGTVKSQTARGVEALRRFLGEAEAAPGEETRKTWTIQTSANG